MTLLDQIVLLVVSDPVLTQQLIGEMVRSGRHYQLPIATSVAEARVRLHRIAPVAIVLDELAVGGRARHAPAMAGLVEAAARELAQVAPVVVLVSPEHQADLASLVSTGHIDVVARARPFLPLVAGLVERRMVWAERSESQHPGMDSAFELPPDFGEVLRHEVNNPLTGILGNAELLLARRDRLPATVVQRLETIADLAVRLRETIRRISNAWEARQRLGAGNLG